MAARKPRIAVDKHCTHRQVVWPTRCFSRFAWTTSAFNEQSRCLMTKCVLTLLWTLSECTRRCSPSWCSACEAMASATLCMLAPNKVMKATVIANYHACHKNTDVNSNRMEVEATLTPLANMDWDTQTLEPLQYSLKTKLMDLFQRDRLTRTDLCIQ